MPETFLILLAAGILLAVLISDPAQVTWSWLRLAGILALCLSVLGGFFMLRRAQRPPEMILYVIGLAAILGQLGLAQSARGIDQRLCAALGALSLIGFSLTLLVPHHAVLISYPLIAATTGLALMTMLLGHAYLTASRLTMRPFARLNNSLALFVIVRILSIVPLTIILKTQYYDTLKYFGFLIIVRWLVGLLVPAVFIFMTRDCIKCRATQSATGILYVTVVLVSIGELMALHLVQETGFAF